MWDRKATDGGVGYVPDQTGALCPAGTSFKHNDIVTTTVTDFFSPAYKALIKHVIKRAAVKIDVGVPQVLLVA